MTFLDDNFLFELRANDCDCLILCLYKNYRKNTKIFLPLRFNTKIHEDNVEKQSEVAD